MLDGAGTKKFFPLKMLDGAGIKKPPLSQSKTGLLKKPL